MGSNDSLAMTLNKQPDISPAKQVYSGNNKELQLRTCDLIVNHIQVQRKRGGEWSFPDLGETVENELIGRN